LSALGGPRQRLSYDDGVSVESHGRPGVQPVAEAQRFAHAMAERAIVRAREHAIAR